MHKCKKFSYFTPMQFSEARLYSLLSKLDSSYASPVSTRVNLSSYVKKLSHYADIVVASVDSEDIALCAFYTNTPPNGYISTIVVLEGFQKNGLGTTLIEFVKEIAKEKGCTKLGLEVFSQNYKARSFYLKQGFYVCEDTESNIINDKMSINMTCKLYD